MSTSRLKQLIDIEESLSSGTVSKNLLDADSSRIATSYFLRAYRGRADLSQALPADDPQGFVARLEQIRSALFCGKLDNAEALLNEIDAQSALEESEMLLERCRLSVLRNDFAGAIQIADRCLNSAASTEVSRMTLFQLKGQALLGLNQHPAAIEALQSAVALSDLFPEAPSAYQARAFLVRAHSECGNEADARTILDGLHVHLDSLEQDELWLHRLLTVLRAEVHYFRCFEKWDQCSHSLFEAREVAKWLNEQTSLSRCEVELEALAASGRLNNNSGVHRYSSWVYLRGRNVILSFLPKKVSRLHNFPIVTKMLVALLAGPLSAADLFTSVYGLKYDSERHSSHFRATLSKVRKQLPPGTLVTSDGLVSIR